MKKKINKKTLRNLAENDVPDVKQTIKATDTYQTFMSNAKTKKPFSFPYKRLAFATSFAMLVLLTFIVLPFGNVDDPEPLGSPSTIYFEINPSFELTVDEDDEIIALIGQNEDGKTVVEANDHIVGMPYEAGFDELIDALIEADMIDSQNSIILYDVLSENSDLLAKHLTLVEDNLTRVQQEKMPEIEMARGMGGSPTDIERDIADDYDLSIMHVRLIGNILSESDEYDFETLAEKSIKELLDIESPPRHDPDRGPNRHPFDNDDGDDDNGAPPINPPRGRDR